MMSETDQSVLIDGISTIGYHNGVYRIDCYRLDAGGKPENSVELLIPSDPVAGFVAALAKLSDTSAPAAGMPATPKPAEQKPAALKTSSFKPI
jgi:hypothetical protein